MSPDWHARAACRDHPDPDLWFPGTGQHLRARRAAQICAGCPVCAECADWADRNRPQFGIWAGRAASNRDTTNPRRGTHWSLANLQPCGTVAAYVRHRRRGEAPCQACRDANARYYADIRQRTRSTNGADLDENSGTDITGGDK